MKKWSLGVALMARMGSSGDGGGMDEEQRWRTEVRPDLSIYGEGRGLNSVSKVAELSKPSCKAVYKSYHVSNILSKHAEDFEIKKNYMGDFFVNKKLFYIDSHSVSPFFISSLKIYATLCHLKAKHTNYKCHPVHRVPSS